MKKLTFFFSICVAFHFSSCDSGKDQPSVNQKGISDLKGVYRSRNSLSEIQYLEFKDSFCYTYTLRNHQFRNVYKDSIVFSDGSLIMRPEGKQTVHFNNDGSISIGSNSFEASSDAPSKDWFKSTEIELEKNDLLTNNNLGMGIRLGMLMVCKPNSDYYMVINTQTWKMTDVWLGGTYPISVESDDELVYAATNQGYSLLIHLTSGGKPYEEITGMGTLSSIAIQPGSSYLWLYSQNDTLYQFDKNTLEIAKKTHIGGGFSESCWFNEHLLFSKDNSLYEFDPESNQVLNTFLVKEVNRINGLANLNGSIWLNADGNRLIKLKPM